ncbi:MAG: transglycosylase domain-containing protein [Peptostreptococcaceae bacterium]|nr:transglycosylase domain-containing protein [Peptostreptococcaceae bacterium]
MADKGKNKNNEIDKFLSKFEEDSNTDDILDNLDEISETDDILGNSNKIISKFKLKKSKTNSVGFFKVLNENYDETGEDEIMVNGKLKKNKKYKVNVKRILLIILIAILICILTGFIAVASIIHNAPKINPTDIYDMISESTIIYDDEGNKLDSVFSEQNRTIIQYEDLPEDLVDSFIALEDKTFREHNGFNWIRIMGAIKESLLGGGQISGTSTITQQLARNVYLPDVMSTHSMNRKIIEAYYSVQIEDALTKDQILTAYLNTIYLGYGCFGVQTASQAYFSKDVNELSLIECASLATLPQAPDTFSLIKYVDNSELGEDNQDILQRGTTGSYVWNDKSKDRRNLTLKLMYEQGYITKEEYNDNKDISIADILNPYFDMSNSYTSYFTDYLIKTVISDIMTEFDLTYSEAHTKVYNSGLKIYSTLDSQAQSIIEQEFEVRSNFPYLATVYKDSSNNIISAEGDIMLYAYSNFIDENETFVFKEDEYKNNKDGSITIKQNKRLNIYNTTVNGEDDFSLELKSMYTVEDGSYYTIPGGFITLPQGSKSRDGDDNLVISAEFLENNPDFFTEVDGMLAIPSTSYAMGQQVIQPQASMTITEVGTGQVKAMVGGREIEGRMLYNRAVNPRQPGSSIKPLAVYSAALQKSYEHSEKGELFPLVDFDNCEQGTDLYGRYLTAGSIIVDEPHYTSTGSIWPRNSGGGYGGLMTMRTALQKSINVVAVKLWEQVGAEFSANLVEKYGITTLDTEGDVSDLNPAALALGGLTNGVTTLEMSAAYCTFPNGGIEKSPVLYTSILNRNDEEILTSKSEATKVLDEGVAWIMTDMLKSVVTNGLGSPARLSGIAAGGKTGTTSNNYDIWFDGFTPTYAASLWIGTDVNVKLSTMSYKAAALWGKIMNQIPAAKEGSYKDMPSNVIYSSGEYYTTGTAGGPSISSLSKTVTICSETGFLATPDCPNSEQLTGIDYPYDSKSDKALPTYYCNIHNTNINAYPISPNVTLVPFIPEPVPEPGKPDKTDKTDKTEEPIVE